MNKSPQAKFRPSAGSTAPTTIPTPPPSSSDDLPSGGDSSPKVLPEDATFKVITVTPELAKKWLSANAEGQRAIRKNTVETYAGDMLRGAWKLLPQMIIFDENGKLVDGQHRLSAVVKADVSVRFWVAAAPGVSVHDALDRGTSRTIGDLLGWHSSKVAVAVNLYKLMTMSLDPKRVTRDEVILAHEYSKDDFEAVFPRLHRIYLPSAVAAACIFARPLSPTDVDEFVGRVRTGAGLETGDPALTFRNWIFGEGNYRNRRGGDPMIVAFAALGSLKHFIEGVPQKAVHVGPTGYRWVCVRRRGLKIPNTPTVDQLPEGTPNEVIFPKRLAGKQFNKKASQ